MIDKLKVGMYLRHSDLNDIISIQKIERIKTPGRCGADCNVFTDKCKDWFIDSDYIEIDKSKYSFDILDLLEPNDLLYIDINNGFEGGLIIPRVPETEAELEKFKTSFRNKETILVGVVTHEYIFEGVSAIPQEYRKWYKERSRR